MGPRESAKNTTMKITQKKIMSPRVLVNFWSLQCMYNLYIGFWSDIGLFRLEPSTHRILSTGFLSSAHADQYYLFNFSKLERFNLEPFFFNLQFAVRIIIKICERRATLSAVRTCLEFCSVFSAQYPTECDLQGLGKIEKLQKLSEIPYCTTQYEKKASDCIKSFE